MVGSKDYFNEAEDGNVNVTISPRQPGSSIKVVTYAAALENGLTAATIIDDTPVSFVIPGQPNYTPVNYDGRFHGPITLRGAFANSYNVPAVKTLNRIGVKNMIEMGKRMGITTWNDESRFGLALTLGGGEVTLLDMATVYGVLANSGKRVDLGPILRVSDYTGRIYYEKGAPVAKTVTSSEIAFIISDILSDNRARTPAFGPSSALVIPGKTVSVKTGTTNEKKDNVTYGYTPSYVVGVWVGNNDNTPMDPYLTSGVTGATPIWNQIMTELIKNRENEPFVTPPNIVSVPCFGRSEYFINGTEPKQGCGTLPSPFSTPTPPKLIRQRPD
jgi:membrane carboxypeptidase/penicillin-binding protein PbpC